jgi:hypothetical protein
MADLKIAASILCFLSRMSSRGRRGAIETGPLHAKFSAEEDAVLCAIMADNVPKPWDVIAQSLPGRNARQCRERWKHYLSCGTTSAPWSPEEDQIIFDKISLWGPKWTRVAAFLGNRTDVEVKLRWMKKFNHIMPMIPKSARKKSLGEEPIATDDTADPPVDPEVLPNQLPRATSPDDGFSFGNSAPAESQVDEWWR